ncbi:MAG TPA: hypothetical protein DCL81_15120 [Algoriphagus sp.]|uniref:hypothetical protein n=1 Tax=Algoriphagus sp. TaxID=1872435 RepID=UPI000C46AA21|nr:hypothetical protein [Algoriphagus sp.]MAL13362.1 hypothetical protein [Algoriphagus sp.]MAN85570.1 hypothetical protein [Algoriphagus sp.]HAD51729.1 hypothetical protein [Algoriphagus sp.]HAH37784.1 hypothetical protein [Algoriphagus sp.]HAS58496.1 hypothetical protein [Algoriphagus sp.]
MNNINSLQKASKILFKILVLDKKIIAIEKLASQIANDPVSIKLDFNLANQRVKEENDTKVSFDEDGSIITENRPMMGFHAFFMGMQGNMHEKKNEFTERCSFSINETVGLEVLGVLLNDLHKERNNLISKLKVLGFII